MSEVQIATLAHCTSINGSQDGPGRSGHTWDLVVKSGSQPVLRHLFKMDTEAPRWMQSLQCMLWSRQKPLQVVRWLAAHAAVDEATQAAVLDILAADMLLTVVPLEPAYHHSLLKFLIDAIERQRLELSEDLVEAYSASLLQQACPKQDPTDPAIATKWFIKTFCFAASTHISTGSHLAMVQQHAQCASAHLASLAAPPVPDIPAIIPALDVQTPAQRQHSPSASTSQVDAPTSPVRPQHHTSTSTEGTSPCSPCLFSLRLTNNMLAGGTGCAEWEAGLVLAEALLNQPALVQGKTCLELGCGAGLLGMAAVRAGAASVVLTDGDVTSAQNCMWNCCLNGIPAHPWPHSQPPVQTPLSTVPHQQASQPQVVQCGVLEWSDALSRLPPEYQPEVILGSDLLYDPVVIPYFATLFSGLCCDRHSVIYLATTRRNEATLELFLNTISGTGLQLQDVTGALQEGAARFQELPWLEDARPRVIIHKITAASHDL